MAAAARMGDKHTCPASDPKPHVGGFITTGATTVKIEGMPAARLGDSAECKGPLDAISSGSSTVMIEGMPAARMGDKTVHGGLIINGSPTVDIG